MKTTVKLGDKVIDQKLTNFGVRTIEWKPTGFYLNGERVQLKASASTMTWAAGRSRPYARL